MDTDDHTTAPHDLAKPTLRDPLLLDLERYWRTLRHASQIPARSDLNPNQIDDVLPHAFILQRVAPGMARFRVAGQRLHDLLKMDARGMPLSTLFDPQERNTVQDLIEEAFNSPAILGLPLISHGSLLRPTVHAAMLLLPMQDDKGQNSRLLGALVVPQMQYNRPRRFVIDPAGQLRRENLGLSLATATLRPKAPAQSKRPDAQQHPALRLVVNNG